MSERGGVEETIRAIYHQHGTRAFCAGKADFHGMDAPGVSAALAEMAEEGLLTARVTIDCARTCDSVWGGDPAKAEAALVGIAKGECTWCHVVHAHTDAYYISAILYRMTDAYEATLRPTTQTVGQLIALLQELPFGMDARVALVSLHHLPPEPS